MVKVCAECGAMVPQSTQTCWLCGSAQLEDSALLEVAYRPPLPAPMETEESTSGITTLGAFLVFGLVVAGAAMVAPGLAIALVVLGIPVGANTVARIRRKEKELRAEQGPDAKLDWSQRIALFGTSFGVVMGIVALTGVAVVVVLGVVCIVLLTTMSY
jgi:uncharacterized iron-regulated membrane protein